MLAQQGCSLPTNIVESQCLPVITALLQQSNMLTVLPEEAVQSYCKAGLLTVLVSDLPLGVGPFGLITCRQHELSPAAQLMLNAIREQAQHPYPVQRQRPTGARLSLV
jgi:DNA-binding transcriptional LysR family regulator